MRVLTRNAGLHDIAQAGRALPLIFYLAWSDLQARYRRSALGPWWLTLGTAAGTAGLGLVWSELFKLDRAVFVPALTAGLIMWQLLSGCIVEATTTYWRQGTLIRNVRLPLTLYPLQMVVKHAINFLHVLPVFVAVVFIFDVPVNRNTLLVIPCLAVTLANLVWISMLFSMLGARFRDLEYLLAAAMPILMFLSPVFYRPSYLPISGWLIWLNPFSHFIELVRHPLLGTPPPGHVVLTSLAMLAIGTASTLALFNAKRNRIAYWV
ncbi:ABC transporter permease [Ramlibacter tataouinensis]|uniref:Candidate ABC type polysaccharide/polyol phosphate export systems that might be involved in cell envelope biogenesis, permease component n=1 Tax=Ramlibacter tataouinensis (strain ATCC BAA-407 / DSM 14655 / LMG 21543 / TTB310) TaxID=365046 RepID=F5XYY3_RAMTT|nr:ABC transporter permease [Ramlibacter tataouinensis]AEG91971.1 candidate ABC type polysaccharide/polyol phosphate export systems that might be involved in cell envelope biogenesis, permease component [Ramlibacter tataouinensis TTB310]